MQSNNPVFSRSEEFNRSSSGYGTTTYQGNGAGYEGYGAPTGFGAPPTERTERMTIDSVVQSTAITLAVVIGVAGATWMMTPAIDDTAALGTLYGIAIVGSGLAFVLSLVNSFKRVVSPALVLAFAAAEGLCLGALSKSFDAMFGGGIVIQAVIGTFAAFAGTLAAYKYFNIQVNNKFRTFVIAAMFGMVALSLMEIVLGLFGTGLGIFELGAMGLLFSIGGLVLGVFMLILDFDFVEQGVRNGLPARESWRASFGLLVSLVWIYTNLLRILAILQQD
ncbi:Bax inhibitor-1/YccA family protein [Nocardioides sp. GY 10113]|nr:Bax inhibitor-1/YccA family protein [Nocardioides sp. GY 10113]